MRAHPQQLQRVQQLALLQQDQLDAAVPRPNEHVAWVWVAMHEAKFVQRVHDIDDGLC